MLAVTHLRKSGGAAVNQAVGSIAYVAAARAVWTVVRDPDDRERRLFLPIKANLSRDTSGLSFEIVSDMSPADTPVLRWDPAPVRTTAEEALNPDASPGRPPREREEAAAWLAAALEGGPVAARDIFAAAKADGVTLATLRNAKTALAVRAEKSGFQGSWIWSLPA